MNPWDFIQMHGGELAAQFLTHLELMGWSLGLALLLAAPLAIAMLRWKALVAPILAVAGIMQTIPSVALLGFLLPWFGIGSKPAVIALVLYALLPLVRNGYVGLSGTDPLVLDAARGMGMYWRQILWQVRLPLALPVIFAGIRTAAVINVGVTTLSALVGAGGLGVFIFRGIATDNMAVILLGALPAALLAVSVDGLLAWVQHRLAPRRSRSGLWIAAALILVIFALALIRPWSPGTAASSAWTGGFTSEFMERPDGFRAFVKTYGLTLKSRELDPSLLYDVARDGQVDLACGFSTDGRIPAYHLRVLKDDRHFFPDYTAGILVRNSAWQAHPELAGTLASLEGVIDDAAMQRMNYLVDKEGRDPRSVADEFLEGVARQRGVAFDRKLAAEKSGSGSRADVVVGSKGFTEQYILGYLLADWINGTSPLKAGLREGLGGTGICFDALRRGDIDLYPEYSGTALLTLLKIDPATHQQVFSDSTQRQAFLREQMSSNYGIRWTSPFGFNNTYAILMPDDKAERLGIDKISDLARYPGAVTSH